MMIDESTKGDLTYWIGSLVVLLIICVPITALLGIPALGVAIAFLLAGKH